VNGGGRSLGGALAAILSVAALAIAGCGGGGDSQSSTPRPTPTAAAKPSSDSGAPSAKLWFTAGEQFHPVVRQLPKSGSTLSRAVEALLAGPAPGEGDGGVQAQTQIPAGVALEKVSVDSDGTASVHLSPNFLEGIPSDSASHDRAQKIDLNARLAQVTYTVTQFGDVKAAKVVAGGAVVDPDLSPDPEIDRADYAKPAAGPPPIVKPKGKKLPGTRQIQTKLAKLAYLPKSAVDGLDGYQTREAVIAFQAWSGLGRDGVVGPATSAALKIATRPVPQPGGPARRIEVYNDKGVTLLIDGGRTVRAIHTSSGAAGTPTYLGRFTVGRKELRSWSVPFSTWLPYASYFNQGIAFHEYADVPPYPASHGCVRVPAPEAKGLYDFATLGTVVVVI
jgi:L,D-transpeptidase catalytic domain/Putative peptidoglycan binding domain/Sporulation and spore germination